MSKATLPPAANRFGTSQFRCFAALAFLFGWLLLLAPARTAPPSAPLRVLFLGNSITFTNDVPGLVQSLADGAGDPFRKHTIAAPNWYLVQHAGYSTPWIDSGNYDIVMLQQGSRGNVLEQDAAVQTLHNHALSAGAKSLFFNTPSWDFGPGDTDLALFRENTRVIRYNYALSGTMHNIAISPAGLAWQTARLNRPDINFYIPNDGHPSLAGSYLMACVHYASLFGRSPAGNPYTAGLPDAAYLQGVAASAVLQDPWEVDLYGYGPNRFYWAHDWNQFVSETTSPLQGVIISGTGGQSSPAVKIDSSVGQAANVYLGVRDDTFPAPGEGRLYPFAGGALTVTGDMVVGKEGKGFVEHRAGLLQINGQLILAEQAGSFGRYAFSGGFLSASQIRAEAGTAEFIYGGGRLSFQQFGSAAQPMNLTQSGGVLAVNEVATAATIFGNFSQSSAAVLERVAGAERTFAVTGTAILGGALYVSYAPEFSPARGWTSPILTAAAVNGTFSSVTLPPPTEFGVVLTIDYTSDAVVVSATQDTSDGDDNGLPDWWETRAFGVAMSGRTWAAEFKNSGLSNGLVYAVGGEFAANPADGLPRIVFVEGQPMVHFVQRTGGAGEVGVNYAVDGLTYVLEVRGDLENGPWQSGSDCVELHSRNDNGNGTETVVVRFKPLPGSETGQRFARLVVAGP